MDGITIKVAGLAELQRKLLELPNNINRNVCRRSLYAGAAMIRDEARLKAPVYTGPVSKGHPPPGTLKRSIIVKFIPELSRNGVFAEWVTVRHGKKYQRQGKSGALSQDAFYWRWVEFGTSKMAARPFLRPAFELKKIAAKDAIIGALQEGVLSEAAKL